MRSYMYRQKQKGFGILEILITVFVLAVGLLGIASLQTLGFRASQGSYMRTIASYKAYEMIDRMRANPDGIAAGSYNAIFGIPQVGTDCSQASCSSSAMATYDANQWNTELAYLLPSGQGTVTRSGSVFSVVVRWDENKKGATGLDCDPDEDTDLSCFTVNVQL